jgi:hypothetical protein
MLKLPSNFVGLTLASWNGNILGTKYSHNINRFDCDDHSNKKPKSRARHLLNYLILNNKPSIRLKSTLDIPDFIHGKRNNLR